MEDVLKINYLTSVLIVTSVLAGGAPSWASDPVRPAPATIIAPATGSDIVNRLLSPGPSDPSVPLPRADLAEQAWRAPGREPSVYGRVDGAGGVIGFKVPISPDPSKPTFQTR